MAVKVQKRSGATEYPIANAISVTDGHLFVQKQAGTSSKTLAIYKPDAWVWAEVQDQPSS